MVAASARVRPEAPLCFVMAHRPCGTACIAAWCFAAREHMEPNPPAPPYAGFRYARTPPTYPASGGRGARPSGRRDDSACVLDLVRAEDKWRVHLVARATLANPSPASST